MHRLAGSSKKIAEDVRTQINGKIADHFQKKGKRDRKAIEKMQIPTFQKIFEKERGEFVKAASNKKDQEAFKQFQHTFSMAGISDVAKAIHEEEMRKNPDLAKVVEDSYKLGLGQGQFKRQLAENPELEEALYPTNLEEVTISGETISAPEEEREVTGNVHDLGISKRSDDSIWDMISRRTQKNLWSY
jgi:DNA-binding cell septation regulator SpoVG